jgi:hypothetical protein
MHRRFARWLVMLVALVSLAGLVGASGALADSNTAAQNASLEVSASLTSSGPDANMATVGDTVVAAGSVTNQSDQRQKIQLAVTLVGPDGTAYSITKNVVVLAAHETVSATRSVVIPAGTTPGTYTLTVSAGNAGGTSSTSASLAVY